MNSNYVEFSPIILKNDLFVEVDGKLTQEFKDNILEVFEYYSVDYKEEGSKILIKKELKKDQDLLWNYCNKAKDQMWLEQHKTKEN